MGNLAASNRVRSPQGESFGNRKSLILSDLLYWWKPQRRGQTLGLLLAQGEKPVKFAFAYECGNGRHKLDVESWRQ